MAGGVLFSVLAAIVLTSGNVVQKHAVNSLPEFSAKRTKHLFRTLATSRLWMAGFVLCLVGVGFEIIAFSLAPIAVVQSIFNASIVLLIVLSRLRLGEHLVRAEWVGLTIVVVSVVAISSTLTSTANTTSQSDSVIRIVVALLPTVIVVGLILVGVGTTRTSGALRYGIAAGLLYGAAALGTKGSSTFVARHGLVSSIPNIATSVYPYVFVAFSVVGMVVYQMGIQRFRIAVVGALSDVVCSTYVVAVGTIVFSESFPREPAMLALRIGGFVGVLLGTVLVASGGFRETPEELPPIESDLGLGSVLVAGVATLATGTAGPPRPVPDNVRLPREVPDLYELERVSA